MTATLDEEGFLRLLEEHRRILFKVANAYCRDREDREDLVQEMVIQLWRSFPRYDDQFKFSTWMYRVAMNVAISFHRQVARRGDEVSIDQPGVIAFATTASIDSDASTELLVLRQLIRELDELNRALVILYMDGHSHGEIASILGISATNVATRIGRIKQKLQSQLDASGRKGEDDESR